MLTQAVDIAALAREWDEVQLAVLDNPELAQRAAAIADALRAFERAAGRASSFPTTRNINALPTCAGNFDVVRC